MRGWVRIGAVLLAATLIGSCADSRIGSSFGACDDRVTLAEPFSAWEYPETAGNEVPDGSRVIHVRSGAEGDPPPERFSDFFREVPGYVTRSVADDDYQAWRDGVGSPDLDFANRGSAFFPTSGFGLCDVSLSLSAITPERERPDDWSLVFVITDRGEL